MPNKQSPWFHLKSWNEVVDHAKNVCDIAILPMGATEQHGPHLPTGHDTLQMFPMCERIAEKTGAMLLPCPMYGAHPHHHWNFPGTIPLQNDTCRFLIKDIIRGAAVAGYKKFIIFFGHGQAFVTNYTVQELGQEGYYVLSVMFQNAVRKEHNEIFETPFWHADEAETSIALSLFPQYVDMKLAAPESGMPLLSREFVTNPTEECSSKPMRFDEGTVSGPEYLHAKLGVIGEPLKATKEKGDRYVDAIVGRMIALVEQIKKEHPLGQKVVVN